MKIVTEWKAPDISGVPILTMPNIPRPLQGSGCQPRTIVGKTEWDKMRFECYAEHDDICEICGQKLGAGRKDGLPLHQAHELFDYDFENCTATFNRLCCICPRCHQGIHSGRALTMFRNHGPYHTKEYMLGLLEHVFGLIQQWNITHPHDEPLRMWATIVAWAEEPCLAEEVSALIDKYDTHFYRAKNCDGEDGTWNKWKLIYDGEEYYSPYQDQKEYEETFAKLNKMELDLTSLFSEDPFVEMRNNIKKSKEKHNESTEQQSTEL